MKKLFALILALLMLSSCGKQEEPKNEELNIIDEVSYLGENGKYGFHNNGVPVTEAIFDEVIPEGKTEHRFIYFPAINDDEIGKLYAGAVTDGTRKTVDRGEKGGTALVDEPNTNYILYESGSDSVINEIPLSNFVFIEPDGRGNGNYYFYGAFEGDRYEYKRESDRKWELYAKESGDISFWMEGKPQSVRYFWSNVFDGHGFADSEGNIIVEPIYSKTEIINDRIFAYDGYGSKITDDITKTYIMDFGGNIVCDSYIYIERGTYGTGRFVLYAFGTDEEGNFGYWFIDESGNKLSERFESIRFVSEYMTDEDGHGDNYESKAEVTKDGKTEMIFTENYVCNYNMFA